MNKITISKIYSDKYTDLLLEINHALEEKKITENQAKLLLGIIFNKKFNAFINQFINKFAIMDDSKRKNDNVFMYIDYSKKIL
jgi:hypothetical protein